MQGRRRLVTEGRIDGRRTQDDDPGQFRVWVLGAKVAESGDDDLGRVLGDGEAGNVRVSRDDGEDAGNVRDATRDERDVV